MIADSLFKSFRNIKIISFKEKRLFLNKTFLVVSIMLCRVQDPIYVNAQSIMSMECEKRFVLCSINLFSFKASFFIFKVFVKI